MVNKDGILVEETALVTGGYNIKLSRVLREILIIKKMASDSSL